MTADYKQEFIYLGGSDIGSLTIRYASRVYDLSFGEDGDYMAWIVHDWNDADIPKHYHNVISIESSSGFGAWAWIYDDTRCTVGINHAERIEIYRAG